MNDFTYTSVFTKDSDVWLKLLKENGMIYYVYFVFFTRKNHEKAKYRTAKVKFDSLNNKILK